MTLTDSNKLTDETTTIASWALAVCRTIDAAGIDSQKILDEIGIDKSILQDPNARLPTQQMTQLWRRAVTITADEAIGLKVANFVQPTSFNALSFSLLVSESLADAWSRVKRYHSIISNVLEMDVEHGPQESALCFNKLPGKHYADEAIDAFMATSYLMPLQVSNGQIKPTRLVLERRQPFNPKPFEQLFNCPINYAANGNKIYYSNQDLQLPFPSANKELALKNDEAIQSYFQTLSQPAFSKKVSEEIAIAMTLGNPDRDTIAKTFHMSSRNLQRKLREEGTSFSEQVELFRKDLAQKYLSCPQLSMLEISFRLGFKDPSNFTRAFKRWYGVSPLQYRQRNGSK
ncbi:AraC family transcriptional regulator [Shewanella schlegeliana]|uniref:AraC family transcriptional regulator n=2 Tax=Shewanella TaxID=22 RepID=A0ABS1SVH7_9GAMM|nr:AraC family transcriptional regulator [Shewanella schlegeliana]MBL4912552.1 AraC family transcriptional regulator [Shewanella schlegeliana]MCL1107978.1 AraC family transcriptional regulator [Shewanella schlegeliana]GIU21261.1 transcriptional regulator [Shewanella schlegeliana]